MEILARRIAGLLVMSVGIAALSAAQIQDVERIRRLLDADDLISTVNEVLGTVSDGAAVAAGGPVRLDEAALEALTRHATEIAQRMPAAPPTAPAVGIGQVADGITAHDALARLERYGVDRAEHLERLQRDRRVAEVELRAWERREASVRSTANRLGSLMGDPAAAAFFQNELGFAWVDYETALLPRIAGILNAQRALVGRYDAAIAKQQAEDEAYRHNLALVRDAIRARDQDAKFVGTWRVLVTADLECERVTGTGTATVEKGSRPGEYAVTEATNYRRTLKNGCEFDPESGGRPEFTQRDRALWSVRGDRVTEQGVESAGGGADTSPDPPGTPLPQYRVSGTTLTRSWTYRGSPHEKTYTRLR